MLEIRSIIIIKIIDDLARFARVRLMIDNLPRTKRILQILACANAMNYAPNTPKVSEAISAAPQTYQGLLVRERLV